MHQKLEVYNITDGEGNPAGGVVQALGISIKWQQGPLQLVADGGDQPPSQPNQEAPGHNGAFVEGVIDAAIKRLEFYQRSRFACKENEEAIDHLKAANAVLDERTSRRKAEGTEGTHKGN